MKKKLITINDLQKAGILFSTTKGNVSKAVKFGTNSKYSHARLFMGG